MQTENLNNTGSWKNKLEGLEQISGESISDKNAAWEKVYARIERKGGQKKIVWYWVAAASILFAFIIPTIILNQKNHGMADTKIRQTQSEKKKTQYREDASFAAVNNKASVRTNDTILFEKKESVVSRKSAETVYRTIPGKRQNKFRLSDTVSTKALITEAINNSLQAIDTSSDLTVRAAPIKKKLPVVHINELGDPIEIPLQVVHHSEKPAFHFIKLAGQEVYNNSAPLKIKNFATINLKTSPN